MLAMADALHYLKGTRTHDLVDVRFTFVCRVCVTHARAQIRYTAHLGLSRLWAGGWMERSAQQELWELWGRS